MPKKSETDTSEVRRRLEAYLERSEARLAAEEARAARRRERLRRLTLGLLER
ncbi:MAG TPA: hypothetical protein VM290_12075 [Gaiellaceae bacterium]|nr:hypothetical protein [Gaiellaceae bacterium]